MLLGIGGKGIFIMLGVERLVILLFVVMGKVENMLINWVFYLEF